MPYFDHNATTPLAPVARDVWVRANDEAWQNASSPHRSGARVRALLEQQRHALSRILGECAEEQIIFTSGASEAANAALLHLSRTAPPDARLLVNPTEHPCVLAGAKTFFGNRFVPLSVSRDGVVSVAEIQTHLSRGAIAGVVVMAANNETGVLQPWGEISKLCREQRVPFVCDASQWLGKIPAAGIGTADWVFAAAHKFGGPKGVGFLKIPAGRAAQDFRVRHGGEQERGHRAGTEDLPSVAAMLAALSESESRKVLHESTRLVWKENFERELLAKISGTKIVGAGAERLWNTTLAIFPKGENTRWLTKLDRLGFQVSTGSACAAGKDAPSHVLAALGISSDEARRTLRFSAGWETTQADWQALLAALVTVESELAASSVVDA